MKMSEGNLHPQEFIYTSKRFNIYLLYEGMIEMFVEISKKKVTIE